MGHIQRLVAYIGHLTILNGGTHTVLDVKSVGLLGVGVTLILVPSVIDGIGVIDAHILNGNVVEILVDGRGGDTRIDAQSHPRTAVGPLLQIHNGGLICAVALDRQIAGATR